MWFILRRTSLPYSASLSSFLRFLLALDSIAIASAAAGPRAVQRERYSSSSESEVMASGSGKVQQWDEAVRYSASTAR